MTSIAPRVLLRNAVGEAFLPAQLDGCDEISRANDGQMLGTEADRVFSNLLKNVSAEILVLDDIRQPVADVGGVNLYVLLLEIGPFEGDFVQQFFHDGV